MDPLACHCSRCRKAFSSQSSNYARVRSDDFRWLVGEELLSAYVGEQGFGVRFCSICGSTLCGTIDNTVHGIVPAATALGVQGSMSVEVADGLVSVDADRVALVTLLNELDRTAGTTSTVPAGLRGHMVSVSLSDVPLDDAILECPLHPDQVPTRHRGEGERRSRAASANTADRSE